MFRKTLTGSGDTAVLVLIIIILTDIVEQVITTLTFTIMAGDTLILGLAMAILLGL